MRPLSLALTFVLFAGCNKPGGTQAPAPEPAIISLNGAGATFPYPLYSKWMSEYNKLEPRVRINYQSIGSGGGIRQITERTVDFGASDAPMKDELLHKAPGKLLHIPTALGAVVVTYNLPEMKGLLQVTPEVLAAIFLGDVKKWNDRRLSAINPAIKLPDQPLTVVHRSDGSGTSAVFTGYLARVSPAWQQKVGAGTSVNWPAGLGAKGNEGVTGQIKTTPGSLGYVELAYAVQSRLPQAVLKNQAGTFVPATMDTITAAAASVKMPDDLRVSIVDPPGQNAYPIASYTYILLYEEQPDAQKGAALAHFLWWAVHDGQRLAPGLDYAVLPLDVVKQVEGKLRSLKAGGKPLL